MATKFIVLLAAIVSCVAAYPGYHDVDYYVCFKSEKNILE